MEQVNQEQAVRAELEREANQMMGVDTGEQQPLSTPETPSTEPSETVEVQENPATEEPGTAEAGSQPVGQPAFELSDDERAFMTELRAIKEIQDTPFKTPGELVKGYKNAVTRLNEVNETVKPHKQLFDDLRDETFRSRLEAALPLLRHPELASAYLNQSATSRPDPRRYDFFKEEDVARYEKDMADYEGRLVDSRLDIRLKPIEQQRQLEVKKLEFRQKYPDADVDTILEKASVVGQMNPIEGLYKVLEFDNMQSKITAQVRREFEDKLKKAGQTTTPQSTAQPAQKVTADDILKAIDVLGTKGAVKKYGESKVTDALRQDAERAFA